MQEPMVESLARLHLSLPHIGAAERAGLLEALDSGWVAPVGPQIDRFEAAIADRCNRRAAAATASGTAALHLALRLLDVGPGDEVWVASLTFIASASPICQLGATPVFVDSEPRTWNLDPDLLEAALSEAAARGRLPKALIAVDLYGRCADYPAIERLCQRHAVTLIEDAAEALGASLEGRPAGSFGRLALLSFNGNKLITTSGGGMLLADDEPMIARARWLASQARERVAHYEHETLGYNFRLSNLLAGLGLAQLARLDELVAGRRAIAARYRELLGDLPGLEFPIDEPGHQPNHWLSVLLIDPRRFGAGPQDVRLELERRNIESRPLWKPLHLQPVFRGARTIGGEVAESLFARGLCLPSGAGIGEPELARVVEGVRAVHQRARGRGAA
ncbi:DegT/DnrJ/EryC1/StrS family aminotransferase [Nannocystaceae bacterium ST9]